MHGGRGDAIIAKCGGSTLRRLRDFLRLAAALFGFGGLCFLSLLSWIHPSARGIRIFTTPRYFWSIFLRASAASESRARMHALRHRDASASRRRVAGIRGREEWRLRRAKFPKILVRRGFCECMIYDYRELSPKGFHEWIFWLIWHWVFYESPAIFSILFSRNVFFCMAIYKIIYNWRCIFTTAGYKKKKEKCKFQCITQLLQYKKQHCKVVKDVPVKNRICEVVEFPPRSGEISISHFAR